MIEYFKEMQFEFSNEVQITKWLTELIENEGFEVGVINYIFCDDEYLLEKNIKYLKHNTLTDIISFDYSDNETVSGDIFVSVERIKENALDFNCSFNDELHRVMAHGTLHFCRYKDKSKEEKIEMRAKEDYYLSLRTFK